MSIYILGSARRKKKVVHRTAASDDKKLQASLKKLMMNNIPGVNYIPFHVHAVRNPSILSVFMENFIFVSFD